MIENARPGCCLGNYRSIAEHEESTTAEEDYDAEIAAAEDAYGLDLADATLTGRSAVVGEETTFLWERLGAELQQTLAAKWPRRRAMPAPVAGHAAKRIDAGMRELNKSVERVERNLTIGCCSSDPQKGP